MGTNQKISKSRFLRRITKRARENLNVVVFLLWPEGIDHFVKITSDL